jgi:hypothetical protein
MDPDHDRALMVQLPDDVDLAAQPFAFVAQFDRAVRAAVVPMNRLVAMARVVALARDNPRVRAAVEYLDALV